MARQTGININRDALQHNVAIVRQRAPTQHIIAMVKANSYGCGIETVTAVLQDRVWAFGVACLEEGMLIRKLGIGQDCVLMEGVFNAEELRLAAAQNMQLVIHSLWQLELLLNTALAQPLRIWMKLDSGMHRLGFSPAQLPAVYAALQACHWVAPEIGLMSHFACADVPEHPYSMQQLQCFEQARTQLGGIGLLSMANSAAILSCPQSHYDCVRPGLMLYGVSPVVGQLAPDFGLQAVMSFYAQVLTIQNFPAGSPIGYGGVWQSQRPSKIAVVTAGYGDGYPRHVAVGTKVFIAGYEAPIVGHISMDMMTVDISDCPTVAIHDRVELWGNRIPVEYVAQQAGTIPYELLCQQQIRPSLYTTTVLAAEND
ncbi:MAG: alanine racemase [Legionellaceae bacterium]|nr:alanine racemase [Legionellaceae bacterium]